MSSIREFYIDKEKRELINTIGSAKYVSEEQKEAMISVMLKEQDVDDLKDQVRDMEKKLSDKVRNDEWDRRDDEAVALQDRIDKKKKDIKDKESRTTHGAGHKSPGQTTYRGGSKNEINLRTSRNSRIRTD